MIRPFWIQDLIYTESFYFYQITSRLFYAFTQSVFEQFFSAFQNHQKDQRKGNAKIQFSKTQFYSLSAKTKMHVIPT